MFRRFICGLIAAIMIGSTAMLPIPARAQTVATIVQAVNGGSGVHATSSGTAVFTTAPPQGDLIYIVAAVSGCTSLTPPSGFTELGTASNTNRRFYKIAGASESNAYQFTDGATTCFMNYVAYDVTAENQSSPFDAFASQGGTGTAASTPTSGVAPSSSSQPDLPIATFTTPNAASPTQNGTGYTLDANTSAANVAVYSASQRAGTSSTSNVSDSITYGSSATWGGSMVLIAPAVPVSNPASYVQGCNANPTGTQTSVTIICPSSPISGDEFYAGIQIYNTAVGTITTPTGTWNLVDTCVGQSRTVAVYSHTVTSGDASANSFQWSWGTAYFTHGVILEMSGANTTTPVDAHSCAAIAGGTSPQTISSASVTPTQTNDVPILFSGASNSVVLPTAGSESGGGSGTCTIPVPGNSGSIYTSGEYCPATSTTAGTSVTETYSTAQSGGYETDVLLVSPTVSTGGGPPLPQGLTLTGFGGPHISQVQSLATYNVPAMAPIYEIAQSTTSCGGGYVNYDQTAAQDVFWGFYMCSGDAKWATISSYCFSGGNCHNTAYISPSQLDCSGSGQTLFYTYLYNNPQTNDGGFVHTGLPYSSSNRFTTTGGRCSTTGGSTTSTPNYFYYPNEANSIVATWEINNYYLPSNWVNGSTWNGLFWDNQSIAFPGGNPNEYPNVTLWRKGIATAISNVAPYAMVLNSEGPGANAYPHNNGTGSGMGILNWTIDDKDICDNLSSNNGLLGLMFEKILGDTASMTIGGVVTPSDYIFPSNAKTAINTAAAHWNDPNCSKIMLLLSGMTGEQGTTSWVQRAWGVVLRGLMTRTGYTGDRSMANVGMGTRFPKDIQNTAGLNESTAFPEDGLVMTQPVVPLSNWVCSTGVNGSCSSNADKYGGGCYADTGGVNVLAQLCGTVGNGPDSGTAPVYVREFSVCYKYKVNIGPCGVIANMSTSTNITLSQLSLTYTYTEKLTPTGGSIYDDPINAGHPLCTNTTYCDGAWAETAISGTSTIPHCTVLNPGSNAALIDAMNSANDCFWIVLTQ